MSSGREFATLVRTDAEVERKTSEREQARSRAGSEHEPDANGRGDDMARLQRGAGNRAVSGLLAGAQRKLHVGAATDPAEREADAIASEVVKTLRSLGGSSPENETGQRASDDGRGAAAAHRPVAPLARRVQRRAPVGLEGGEVDEELEARVASARSGGSALAGETRRKMETAFGADFSDVRVHEGQEAAQLNRALGAEAFTIGRDIFFRDGVPDGAGSAGQQLLAHELTHTIQQGAASVSRAAEGAPGTAEKEGGEDEKPISGTVPNVPASEVDSVEKGPDDRARDRMGRRTTPQKADRPAAGPGTQVLKVAFGGPSLTTSTSQMTEGQVVEQKKRDAIKSTATTAWSNPGGKNVSAFGSESFSPAMENIAFTEKDGTVNVSLKINTVCSWGVKSDGQKDVKTGTSPLVTATNYKDIVADLTPKLVEKSWRAPRRSYWSEDICARHERYHSTDDKDWLEGAGKAVVTDFLDKQTIALKPEDSATPEAKQKAITKQVTDLAANAKTELGTANFAYYKGGAASYFSYAGEEKAFGDGKQPYIELAAAVETQGKALEAKAKADAEKAAGPPPSSATATAGAGTGGAVAGTGTGTGT